MRRTFTRDVKSLPDSFFIENRSDLWMMSPPCQPYTKRGKELDSADPRAAGLKRLTNVLRTCPSAVLPYGILLENVPGFESSHSLSELQDSLRIRGFSFVKRELCPTQFEIPNRRKRFYLVAVKSSKSAVLGTACDPPGQHTERPLEEFLVGDPERDYYDEEYKLPAHYLRYQAALDVVTRSSTESDCFTGAYGRYAKGSGSVLRCGSHGMRLFSSKEITRLHDFPGLFEYPQHISELKRYQLVGNSVNVKVVAALSKDLLSAAARASQSS
mmetsp:Transcript_30320/g.116286  ORF Transcript_30320/g.116286 Transcript_30320/m.116286 type:complete len:271 (-) Transcript_30320:2159-2971(-)